MEELLNMERRRGQPDGRAQSHSFPVIREGWLDAIIAFGETLQVGSKRPSGSAPRRARALQSAGFFVFGLWR